MLFYYNVKLKHYISW